ncbi:unnamed protein product [Closterium sp. NIES-54]
MSLDKSVPFYRLFPYRSAPPPPPPFFPFPGPPLVGVGSGAARGAASGGAASGGAEPGGAESEGAGSGGAEPGGAEPAGVEPGGAKPVGVEPGGAESEGAESGGAEPRGTTSSGDTRAGGARVTAGAGGSGGVAAAGPRGARTRGTGADGSGGVGGAGGTGAGGAGVGGAGAIDPGAGGARGIVRPRAYFVPLLQQVLVVPSSTGLPPPLLCPLPDQSQPPLQPASPLPAPSPYNRADQRSYRASQVRLRSYGDTNPLLNKPFSPNGLVVGILIAACRLDYACALVAESESASPSSVGGECALGTDVLKDRQEDFECLPAAVPRFASMLLAPEKDPDAPDIPTPRSYAEAIEGPYSSQWQAAMDVEMAS